jgi:hypothetical protein
LWGEGGRGEQSLDHKVINYKLSPNSQKHSPLWLGRIGNPGFGFFPGSGLGSFFRDCECADLLMNLFGHYWREVEIRCLHLSPFCFYFPPLGLSSHSALRSQTQKLGSQIRASSYIPIKSQPRGHKRYSWHFH